MEDSDHLRNFQPVITGEVIMETFGLPPGKEVGVLKTEVREAILDGKVRNEFAEAYPYLLAQGERIGLKPVKRLEGPLPPADGEGLES